MPAVNAVTVRPLASAERGMLATWLSSLDLGMVYAAPAFAQFVSSTTGAEVIHLAAWRGDKIVGVLPFAVSARHDGHCVINSLPWYGSHGGCWLERADDRLARRALIEAYGQQVAERSPLFAVTILSPWEEAFVADYETILGHRVMDGRIGQISKLPSPSAELESDLAARLKQKTRNLVRKSCRQDFVEVVGDHDASWAYLRATHVENMRALGAAPKPQAHFDALRARFPGTWSRLSIAYLDDRPVAGLLLLKFAKTVEYLVPVVSQDFRSRQPLSFLIWRAMLECAGDGFRYWNWGGTWPTQDTLRHFKAGWGSEELPYSYLVSASDLGLERFRANREETMAAFPHFYLYPLRALHDAHCA